jgi:hypothetical protein
VLSCADHTAQTGVKWDDVAAAIPGRDAKSCNNKVTDLPEIREADWGD